LKEVPKKIGTDKAAGLAAAEGRMRRREGGGGEGGGGGRGNIRGLKSGAKQEKEGSHIVAFLPNLLFGLPPHRFPHFPEEDQNGAKFPHFLRVAFHQQAHGSEAPESPVFVLSLRQHRVQQAQEQARGGLRTGQGKEGGRATPSLPPPLPQEGRPLQALVPVLFGRIFFVRRLLPSHVFLLG
jgi:hypothetical protein